MEQPVNIGKANISFKASETLLGIETEKGLGINRKSCSFKASETLLGIETGIKTAEAEARKMLQSL